MRRLLYRLVAVSAALSMAAGAISQIDQIRNKVPDAMGNLTETVWESVTGAVDTVIPFWDATTEQSPSGSNAAAGVVDEDKRVRLVEINTPEKEECGVVLVSSTLEGLVHGLTVTTRKVEGEE